VLTWLFGSTGLILANCVNMAIRIWCSILFINDFFYITPFNPVKDSIPSKWLNIIFIIIWIVTALSEVPAFYYHRNLLVLFCLCRFISAIDRAGCGG